MSFSALSEQKSKCAISKCAVKYALTVTILTLLILAEKATADEGQFLHWHSTDVQFLNGNNFELGSRERTTITFQHANGWKYGDNFLFYDMVLGDASDYFEYHPRLSLSKISDRNLTLGPIKDILIAGTLEVPATGSARYLGGLGIDWDVPGFSFLKTNFYLRDNPDLAGNTWGTTFSWKRKIDIGNHKFLLDGFWDMAGSEGNRVAYQLIVPALMIDIGHYLGNKDHIYSGIEYQYWHNKFGVDGVTESAVQAEIRWVF